MEAGSVTAKPVVGLIETMRVRDGRIPLLDRHLARLERSLAALALPRPAQDVRALVRPFAETGDAVLRLEVCEGRAAVTVREVPALNPPVVITASEHHIPYPHKTTERDRFEDAADEAEVAEADDALLVTAEGWVAEGTTWNLFWWEGDRLRTPTLELGVLPGIARARVLELARVEEGKFRLGDLAGRSLFLANAVRGVQPIGSLDGEPAPADPRTAGLAERFWPGEG